MASNGNGLSARTPTRLFNKAVEIVACIHLVKITVWIKSTGRMGISMSRGSALRWGRTQASWEHSRKVELYSAWRSCRSWEEHWDTVGQCLFNLKEEWWVLGRGATARHDGSRGAGEQGPCSTKEMQLISCRARSQECLR